MEEIRIGFLSKNLRYTKLNLKFVIVIVPQHKCLHKACLLNSV